MPLKSSSGIHRNYSIIDMASVVTGITLCAHRSQQGICDEATHLVRETRYLAGRRPTPPANHFSFMLELDNGQSPSVLLGVVAPASPESTFFDCETDLEAVMSARTQLTILTRDKLCDLIEIVHEARLKSNTTLRAIMRLVEKQGEYFFTRTHLQQSGCRHWIRKVAHALQGARIVKCGFAEDVEAETRRFHWLPELNDLKDEWCAAVIEGTFVRRAGQSV